MSRGGSRSCPEGCPCGKHNARLPGPSVETAAKISAALKGRTRGPLPEQTRKKIGDALRGRKRSDEQNEASRLRALNRDYGRGFYYDAGYRFLTKQHGHPLARNGVVQEHRKVLYDAIGIGPHSCYWSCGREDLIWSGGDGINVDHLNGIKDDNRLENLVVSCRRCNRIGFRTGKTRRQQHPCERCGTQTINAKFCSRGCANVR